jgi:hypothetical protein
MNDFGKIRHLIVAVLATALLSACASGGSTEDNLGRVLAAPNKYVLYNCAQLAVAATGALAREKQLEALMAKAGTGADGKFVSAVAYQPEYLQLRGDMNEIRRYSAEKDCKPAPAAAKPATPAVAKPAKRASDSKAR